MKFIVFTQILTYICLYFWVLIDRITDVISTQTQRTATLFKVLHKHKFMLTLMLNADMTMSDEQKEKYSGTPI
jgi:hypothetical protein